MKPKSNPKLIAMMAACAVVINVGSVASAHAQGMPADAQQLIQTMRPMYMSQATPEQAQTADASGQPADDSAYGGVKSGTSESAGGRRQADCGDATRCNIFFGQ
jgi:hypothetical protein